jgi:hypothetical protein
MVIDDVPLAALIAEGLLTVMAPKAHGVWLLHEAAQDMDHDAFVMFSSVCSIFGNPAQGNYSAANAFLDSLMGVEIETMLESSIGVALPPTSLMRARTIGQIATLIAGEMGGDTDTAPKAKVVAEIVETSELDLDSISDDDLDLLLGGVNEEVAAGKS